MKRWIVWIGCLLIASLASGQGGETGGGGGPGGSGQQNLSTLTDDAGCLGNDLVSRNAGDTAFDCITKLPLAQLTDDDTNTGWCLVSGGSSGQPNFVSCPGGGSGGHVIQEEGSPLPARSGLNFATNITCTDDAPNNRTNCSATGGAAGNAFGTVGAAVADSTSDTLAITDTATIDITASSSDDLSAIVVAGSIGTTQIATGGVGSDEIATDAVQSAEILDGSVGTAEAANLATADMPTGNWDPSRVVHSSANDKCAKFDGAGVLIAAGADCGAGGGGVSTVEDIDSNPSYASLNKLSFDQADGFAISNPAAGEAEINLSVADGAIAAGAVDGGTGGEIADDSINHFDIDEADTYSWSGVHTHTADVLVSGVETDYEAGASEGFPRLAQSATPPTVGCDVAAEAGRLYFDNDADFDGSVFICRDLDGPGVGTTVGWKDIDDDGGAGGLTTGDINESSELVTIVGDETGSATGTPLLVFNQAPVLSGKIKRNTVSVDDDICDIADQGSWWYDAPDARFEFCNAGDGVSAPTLLSEGFFTLAGNSGSQVISTNDTLTLTGGKAITIPVTPTDTATVDCDDATSSATGCASFPTSDFSVAAGAVTIASNAVTWAKTEDMAASTILGRQAGSTGDPQELTGAQATALLSVYAGSTPGLVPTASGSNTFLKVDGSWSTVTAGSSAGLDSGETSPNTQINDIAYDTESNAWYIDRDGTETGYEAGDQVIQSWAEVTVVDVTQPGGGAPEGKLTDEDIQATIDACWLTTNLPQNNETGCHVVLPSGNIEINSTIMLCNPASQTPAGQASWTGAAQGTYGGIWVSGQGMGNTPDGATGANPNRSPTSLSWEGSDGCLDRFNNPPNDVTPAYGASGWTGTGATQTAGWPDGLCDTDGVTPVVPMVDMCSNSNKLSDLSLDVQGQGGDGVGGNLPTEAALGIRIRFRIADGDSDDETMQFARLDRVSVGGATYGADSRANGLFITCADGNCSGFYCYAGDTDTGLAGCQNQYMNGTPPYTYTPDYREFGQNDKLIADGINLHGLNAGIIQDTLNARTNVFRQININYEQVGFYMDAGSAIVSETAILHSCTTTGNCNGAEIGAPAILLGEQTTTANKGAGQFIMQNGHFELFDNWIASEPNSGWTAASPTKGAASSGLVSGPYLFEGNHVIYFSDAVDTGADPGVNLYGLNVTTNAPISLISNYFGDNESGVGGADNNLVFDVDEGAATTQNEGGIIGIGNSADTSGVTAAFNFKSVSTSLSTVGISNLAVDATATTYNDKNFNSALDPGETLTAEMPINGTYTSNDIPGGIECWRWTGFGNGGGGVDVPTDTCGTDDYFPVMFKTRITRLCAAWQQGAVITSSNCLMNLQNQETAAIVASIRVGVTGTNPSPWNGGVGTSFCVDATAANAVVTAGQRLKLTTASTCSAVNGGAANTWPNLFLGVYGYAIP